jgi:general secretion pathway protein J
MMRDRMARGEGKSSRRGRYAAMRGFTLIEAMVATVLMGMILAALASITAQWLPNWNRGIARVQRTELVSISLNRLVADLQAAEFIPPNRATKLPLFDGTPTSVILVRSAVGPAARPGLEIVRIGEAADGPRIVVLRSTMPYVPLEPNQATINRLGFANPVALLNPPYRVSFAYAGSDGVWKDTWQNSPRLPTTVRITVRDAATQRTLAISTTALIHVELPAACANTNAKTNCLAQPGDQREVPADENPAPSPAPVQRSEVVVPGSIL